MLIREVNLDDAGALGNLMMQVDAESQYMLFEPGERVIESDQLDQRIQAMKKQGNSIIFVAEKKGQLIGYVMVIGGSANRHKHSVYLVIGILKSFRGRGVGTRLLQQVDQWAMDQGIHRLELTVVTRNIAGMSLYKRMGFAIEGTKRNSLLIDGEFVDEYYMAKLLRY